MPLSKRPLTAAATITSVPLIAHEKKVVIVKMKYGANSVLTGSAANMSPARVLLQKAGMTVTNEPMTSGNSMFSFMKPPVIESKPPCENSGAMIESQ